MTIPNDPHDSDFRGTLPADLQSLDRELSGIRIEERPSFGPELEGELARAWQAHQAAPSKAAPSWKRGLIAAGIAALMIAGVSVPSARAAVAQLVRTVAAEAFPGLFAPEPAPELLLPEIEVQEPPPVVPEPRTEVVISPVDASEELEPSTQELSTIPEVRVTFPGLISRREAERIVERHYPLALQEAGIEGSVKLQFWVDELGVPDHIQYQKSSMNQELDRAALLAATEFRFRPATRNNVPVGTWVELTLHFFAISGAGLIGPDTANSGG